MNAPPLDRRLLILLLLSVAAMACFVASDGDLGFHLATGRAVLASHRIPSTNVLSYTQADHPWLLHQWLPGVLFELTWRSFGIVGVTCLKMALVAAIFAVVYATARVLGAQPVMSFLACLAAATASAFRFESRPYLFTHLTLALSVLCIAHFTRAAAARDERHKLNALLVSALVAATACHLHAGAVDSFLVMALAAIGCAFEPLRARLCRVEPQAPSGMREASSWLAAWLVAALLAAMTLAAYHPIGARILSVPFAMGSSSYLAEHLVEFRNPWRFPFALLLAYWLFLIATLVVLLARVRIVHALWFVLVFAYAALSLRFVRMAFAFSIVAAPCLALALQHTALAARAHVRPLIRNAALIALACAAPLYAYRDHDPGFGFAPNVWPLGQFRFIRAHALRGQAYVSDAWAGTFLGYFYPQRKAFFDNRLDAYSPEFMQVYQSIRYGEPGWDQKLDRYGVEIVLLRYTTPGEAAFQHGRPNLRQLLARDARYTLVRFDDDGELFVRTQGPNAALAARFALRGIDPDRRAFVQAPAACAPALQRAIARGEHSATLLGMTAFATAASGDAVRAQQLLQEAERISPGDAWLAQLRSRLSGPPPSAHDDLR